MIGQLHFEIKADLRDRIINDHSYLKDNVIQLRSSSLLSLENRSICYSRFLILYKFNGEYFLKIIRITTA